MDEQSFILGEKQNKKPALNLSAGFFYVIISCANEKSHSHSAQLR